MKACNPQVIRPSKDFEAPSTEPSNLLNYQYLHYILVKHDITIFV